MGLFTKLFRAPPEAAEIATMRKSMLQIKAHGGATAMLEEFTNGMDEAREPAGYRGFLVENEYLPRIAAKACALMILSQIKDRLLIVGGATDSDLARIKAAPDYKKAYALYVNSDEIISEETLGGLKEKQIEFGREMLHNAGQAGFSEKLLTSPIRMHVAELKERSERDWERWLISATRLEV